MNIRILALALLLVSGAGLRAENVPEWMAPLRDALYKQELNADEIRPLYQAAAASAREQYTGVEQDLALARCEYFMGRAYQYYGRNSEANVHYDEGMRLAEKALETAPSAEAWVLRGENLSQACSSRSWAYTMANGLNVDKYAKNALALNGRDAAAQYLVAARWVFAPAPFNNIKKGIDMMKAILDTSDITEKHDQFNVYSAIGYAYIQQKKPAEARPWIARAREIYPTNKFAAELFQKAQ